jgi:hypothetical protein
MQGIQIRPPIQVVRRAILMAALAFRSSLEVTDHPRAPEACERLLPWLESLGIKADIDPVEHEILSTPQGQLAPEQRPDAYWAGEGATIFLWALGKLSDSPPMRSISDHQAIIPLVRVLHPEAQDILNAPSFRSVDLVTDYFRQVASIRTELQRRRLDEKSSELLLKIRRRELAEIGIGLSDENLSSARATVEGMSIDERQTATGLYFVREHAVSWLFDSRASYFHPDWL